MEMERLNLHFFELKDMIFVFYHGIYESSQVGDSELKEKFVDGKEFVEIAMNMILSCPLF
jgi:hypothetical protein